MDLLELGLILQAIGSLLLLGGYLPQIIKLHKTKNTIGISPLFWVMIVTGCSTIAVNMAIQGTTSSIVFTQVLNAVFATYTLFLVFYYSKKSGVDVKPSKLQWTLSALIIVAFVVIGLTASLVQLGTSLQILGTVALVTAYLPQIIFLNKGKDSTGLSKWLFLILGLGLAMLTVNYIITDTSILIVLTEIVNLSLIGVMFAMTVKYQK